MAGYGMFGDLEIQCLVMAAGGPIRLEQVLKTKGEDATAMIKRDKVSELHYAGFAFWKVECTKVSGKPLLARPLLELLDASIALESRPITHLRVVK